MDDPEIPEQVSVVQPPPHAAIVDRWLADFFHGSHHVRALANPYQYIRDAAEHLKRRLGEES